VPFQKSSGVSLTASPNGGPVLRLTPRWTDLDLVEVSSVVDSVGTTSLTTVSVISTEHGKCSTVKTVQVVMNDDRSGTRPWTESERATLTGLVAEAAR
jgi:acyl-CoA thioesterase FadM